MTGPVENLILITGDEEYLRNEKKRELIDFFGGSASINFHSFDSENLDLLSIRSLIDTVPIFEEKRRILVSGSGLFRKSGRETSGEGPLEIFSDIPESTVVIFDEPEADATTKLFKLVKKTGRIFRFDSVAGAKGRARQEAEASVRSWAAEKLRAEGRDIDRIALQRLLELGGFDMRNLSTEIEKLISYKLSKPATEMITIDDIEAIVSKTISDRVFYMLEEKLMGHIPAALAALDDLFALKTQPMKILYLLARQYEEAYMVKECLSRRMSDAEIMEGIEKRDWQLRRIKNEIRHISLRELSERLEQTIDFEERVKTGRMDGVLAVEILIAG